VPSRPYRKIKIEELEIMFDAGACTTSTLAELQTELGFRNSTRAGLLLAKVNQTLQHLAPNAASAHVKSNEGLVVSIPVTSLPVSTIDVRDEEIEGLEIPVDAWGDYPIDTLLIRHESRTVYDVVRRMEQGSFVMDPDFQRDFIWLPEKQSKLIESVLMRIPLPVFYLAEDEQGRMVVVDGLQRLSTFQNFFRNKLRLKLPGHVELDGKQFVDLSAKLKNRVEDCNLILYIIDAKVPERARLDIFERVNGGVPLTRQQMRNCLYMGPATRFLKQEASTDLFRDATGASLNSKTMRDREFVNRFCAFGLLPLGQYKGDMDEFLARALKAMNSFPTDAFSKLSSEFRNALRNNYQVFGRHAFRKHSSPNAGRSVVNASLWDVMSTGLAKYPEQLVTQKADELRRRFYRLMLDESFLAAITYSPNSTTRVLRRFETANAMFVEVFGANTD
jgi:hypothetical protein